MDHQWRKEAPKGEVPKNVVGKSAEEWYEQRYPHPMLQNSVSGWHTTTYSHSPWASPSFLSRARPVLSTPRAPSTKYPARSEAKCRGGGLNQRYPPSHGRRAHRHLYPSVRLAHNILHSFCLNACPPSSPRRVSRTSVSRLGPSPQRQT